MNYSKLGKNKNSRIFKSQGFTLIEVLIVIGIIAILAAIVVVAINPSKQFAQARNTDRTANVNAILNAVGQRIMDNKGVFAGTFTVGGATYTCSPIPSTTTTINTTMATNSTNPSGDLGCLVPTYISSFPVDPSGPASPSTGYDISVSSAGRVKVCAPLAASENSIPNSSSICFER